MERQAFSEELHEALREIVRPRIQQYIDQRFAACRQQVRYLSALDRKYDDANIIKKGFPGIFSHISDSLTSGQEEDLAYIYLRAGDKLYGRFPEQVTWPQKEDRFASREDNSLLLKVGKSGKRLGRTVARSWYFAKTKAADLFNSSVDGWESWTQTIPLRKLIAFHMQDEQALKRILHETERVQLTIISQMEGFLYARCKGEEMEKLPDFVSSLQDMLDTKRELLNQQVDDVVDEIESEILEKTEKAGTIELRSKFYNDHRLQAKRRRFQQALQKSRESWLQAEELFLQRTRDMAEFFNLQSDIQEQAEKFLSDFKTVFQQHLDIPLKELTETLEASTEENRENYSADEVSDLKDKLAVFIREQLVEPLQTLLEKQVLSSKAEQFFESLLLAANQTSQQAVLLSDVEIEENPPAVSQKPVQWRQLVVRLLREQIINALSSQEQNYEQFVDEQLREIREIENIIEINLESAIAADAEEADREVEHPAKIVRESMQRIQAKVEELQTLSSEKWSDIEQKFREGQHQFLLSLLKLLHEGDAKELQLLNAKYRVKEATKDWQTVWDSRWARVQDRLMLWSRFGWKKSKKYGARIKEFAGFKVQEVEQTKRADISTYLSETDQKMKKLPYIYRRLFNFDAHADERFYVAAQNSVSTFKQAYEQWQQAMPANFAVVGEKGSGKSSFLEQSMAEQLNRESIIQIELSETIATEQQLLDLLSKQFQISAESVQDFTDKICRREERTVVVLECLQNSYVRNINGYEAIEKLCYLISETREKLFWVVSCSRYAWRFLDMTLQISEYFSHVAACDTLDADQIENLILNRHRASGYSLHFEPDTEMTKSRSYRKLQDQEVEAQEYLQNKFFEQLTELAEGNASVAMIFWIRSIRDFDDTYFYIQPLEFTSVDMIKDLDPQVLFTLAAFLLHDTLTAADLAKVLNISIEKSRLLINRLRSRGLLEKIDGLFMINHLMYRQIVRVLKERNIIHLV